MNFTSGRLEGEMQNEEEIQAKRKKLQDVLWWKEKNEINSVSVLGFFWALQRDCCFQFFFFCWGLFSVLQAIGLAESPCCC